MKRFQDSKEMQDHIKKLTPKFKKLIGHYHEVTAKETETPAPGRVIWHPRNHVSVWPLPNPSNRVPKEKAAEKKSEKKDGTSAPSSSLRPSPDQKKLDSLTVVKTSGCRCIIM